MLAVGSVRSGRRYRTNRSAKRIYRISDNNNVSLGNSTFAAWLTDTSYLKDPPGDYARVNSQIDIPGELRRIKGRLTKGGYRGEYQFALDIARAISSARDEHFTYIPDILLSAMIFARPRAAALVSVAEDARGLPEVYMFSDIEATQNGAGFKPSPVVEINGEDAHKFLMETASRGQAHDPDAGFNTLFVNQAIRSIDQDDLGDLLSTYQYPGPTTEYVFMNGSTLVFQNLAIIWGNFSGVKDGRSFFERFCMGRSLDISETDKRADQLVMSPRLRAFLGSKPPSTLTVAPGYPPAAQRHKANAVAGYFLNGSAYEDVAVLTIPSFGVTDLHSQKEFQTTVRNFLKQSVDGKKQKLIVDLRGNPGGAVVLGYDIFRQLFPSIEEYGGTRLRASAAFKEAGTIFSYFLSNASSTPVTSQYGSILNYRTSLTESGNEFKDFKEFFGPYTLYNDSFSAIFRRNMSNVYSTDGFNISGVGDAPLLKTQPFESRNIVMLSDGLCASTCAIFSEFMKTQGRVRTIAVGGRPQYGPMQSLGRTKGAWVIGFRDIYHTALQAQLIADLLPGTNLPTETTRRIVNATMPLKRVGMVGGQELFSHVNFVNNYRKGDATQTPLQFVYEAADCRIFNTANMVMDATATWKTVVDSIWGNAGCVESFEDTMVRDS